MLKFDPKWRFSPPLDGTFKNSSIPDTAIPDFSALIGKVATQGTRQDMLEHFKGYFCRAVGATHYWSSNESWAEADLDSYMREASANAPLFIEAFFDACDNLNHQNPPIGAPDESLINQLLTKHQIGYEIRSPDLILRETSGTLAVLPHTPPSLADKSLDVYQTSLKRSEDLLIEGRGRESVQELLWLLETVATAFRGLETETSTVEGKYFNQIVKDLRKIAPGGTLDRVLEWVLALHGFLSSPTGGGVRHGLDLEAGLAITPSEARLYTNLIRSYLGFLLGEHERLASGHDLST